MASNVLKNRSDCYNIATDESIDSQSKAKRRQRLRTQSMTKEVEKSATKAVVQKDKKWRCDAYQQILKSAVWLNDNRADSQSAIDLVLDLLLKHSTDDCKCVNHCWTHVLIGNTLLERFLLDLKDLESKVTAEEKWSQLDTNADPNGALNRAMNDIPVHKESKFEANLMQSLVNLKNSSALLASVEEALDHWSQALDLGLKLRVLTEDAINRFNIFSHLSSVIQIFAFYNRIESQMKTIDLMIRFCRYFESKYSEMSLTANYYLVKTYIELGAVDRAAERLTRFQTSATSGTDQKEIPETYGQSLNFLAKCEVYLLTGRVGRAAKLLKSFLESDYLKKLTINRYFVKGLALLLASKFASNEFDFTNCFQEFIEPIQMAVCILKRWHPWLSTSASSTATKANNNENLVLNAVGDLDPIWYKFSVLNFAYESMQLSAVFYQNIGMPLDSLFYYNALIRLGRHYCAPVRICKLLIIGSQMDVICDYKLSAQLKLNNALMCLQTNHSSSDTPSVYSSGSSVSTISPDTRRAKEGALCRADHTETDPDCEIIEVIDIERTCRLASTELEDSCEHKHPKSILELRKRLKELDNNYRQSSADSEDLLFDYDLSSETPTEADSYSDDIIDLKLIQLEINFYRLLSNECDPKQKLELIEDRLLTDVNEFGEKSLNSRINLIINEYDGKKTFENYSYFKALKSKMIEAIVGLHVECNQYELAIYQCAQWPGRSVFTYAERMIGAHLLYFEAISRLNSYKSVNNISEDKVWIEYNNNTVDSMDDMPSTTGQSLTPPRPQSQLKAAVPKAPKHKMFKTEEIQDYVTGLYKNYNDSAPNRESLKFPNEKNPFRLNPNSKLNFEVESELRSHSMAEVNNTSHEPNITASIVSNKAEPMAGQRMTRSRTNLMKKSEEICVNEKAVEKRYKRSKATPLPSKTSIDMSSTESLSFSKDLENLNEVFEERLVIREEETLCEGRSTGCDSDLDSVLEIVKRLDQLVASHPSSQLYVAVHRLLTQIYSMTEKRNEDLVGYHCAETNGSIYRYRQLFIAEKKKKLKRLSKYDLKSIAFNGRNVESKQSLRALTKGLPKEWRIVQISTVDREDSKIPELMVCRYQSGKRPVFLKVKSDPQKIIKHFMTQFREIIDRSNASIVNRDRETFWRLRFALDEELMVLLRSVEETWFGPFRGILLGQLQCPSYQAMCRQLMSFIIDSAKTETLVCLSEQLLEVVVESLPSLKYREWRTALKTLFSAPTDGFISKCFQKYEEMFCEVFPIDNKESIFTTYDISPVGLILDKSLDSFPFESLPSLQAYNQSIFRTPSLRVLSLMYETFKDQVCANGVVESDVYYVVNPADNLAKTEDYFKEAFASMKDWTGVIGKAPDPSELKKVLETKDTYIFFGHGAGASYYRTIPEGLDSCTIKCASIVMGCSSGKLFADGKHLETYGTPYRFLINGSPCYVGVLWDVTDKDIDKYSDHLLGFWFSNWKPELNDGKHQMPITRAVSLSRKYCRLKYLIGAATVVYGLPLSTRTK